jgi:hypothetical protein
MVQQNCVPSLLILHDAISGNEFAFVWQFPCIHAWEFHYHALAMLTHFHVLAIFGNADICPPMQPFLAIFIPAAKHLQGFAQAKSLGPQQPWKLQSKHQWPSRLVMRKPFQFHQPSWWNMMAAPS